VKLVKMDILSYILMLLINKAAAALAAVIHAHV